MKNILVRICFNSKNWRQPTGEMHKKESSYVGKHGFGHEDWNFNTAQEVDGNVYGYTYFEPSKHTIRAHNGKFNLDFYTIDPQSKQRLWVGSYRDAWFLDARGRANVKGLFTKRGIIEARIEELAALDGAPFRDSDKIRKTYRKHFYLNARVKAENVKILDPPIILTRTFLGKSPTRLRRYRAGVYLDAPLSTTRALQPGKPTSLQDLSEKSLKRVLTAQEKVVRRYHNRLSNHFKDWLAEIKAQDVVRERQGVDVFFRLGLVSYLAELKVCYGRRSTHAIREGVGQILEYNFYPGRKSADKLLIVLDQEPSFTDISYIERLQTYLPIFLLWPTEKGFSSGQRLGKKFRELRHVLSWSKTGRPVA
jgi:hypothetical protein